MQLHLAIHFHLKGRKKNWKNWWSSQSRDTGPPKDSNPVIKLEPHLLPHNWSIWQNPIPFMIKALGELVLEGNFLSLIKNIFKYLQLTVWLVVRTQSFLLRLEQDNDVLSYHCFSTSYWKYQLCNKKRKRRKMYTEGWEERNKTVFACRWQEHLCRRSERHWLKKIFWH